MQQNEWTDQSNVYNQQYHNFYRWVLYPIIFFLCLSVLFLALAKKEVVIRTPAQLTAQKAEKLQVPIEAKIKTNNLKENQTVKEGEVLVTFDTASLQNEKKQLEQENETIEQQKKAAQTYIDSLTKEQNLFEREDTFGYSNQVTSFLAEKEVMLYHSKQSEATIQKERETYNKTKEELEKQLNTREKEKQELEQARIAWINEHSLEDFSPEVMSKYQVWQTQLSDASEKQKKSVKETILVTIDEQISHGQTEIEQLQSAKNILVPPNTNENEVNSQKAQQKQNKELNLATTKQKMMELTEIQKKNETMINLLNEQLAQSTIKSPVTGIIHLNDEAVGHNELPKGTTLAEIYPKKKNSELNFTARIPTSESMRIKPGMAVHFKVDKKGITSETIDGTLEEISANSTTTEQGTFYIVKGTLETQKSFTNRYGLTGELSLIIGKKTYWQEVKDILLN